MFHGFLNTLGMRASARCCSCCAKDSEVQHASEECDDDSSDECLFPVPVCCDCCGCRQPVCRCALTGAEPIVADSERRQGRVQLRAVSSWNIKGVPWESHRVFSRIGEWRVFNDSHLLAAIEHFNAQPFADSEISKSSVVAANSKQPVDASSDLLVCCFQEAFSFHKGGVLMDYTSRCDASFVAASESALLRHAKDAFSAEHIHCHGAEDTAKSEPQLAVQSTAEDRLSAVAVSDSVVEDSSEASHSGTESVGSEEMERMRKLTQPTADGSEAKGKCKSELCAAESGYGRVWERFVLGLGIAMRPLAFGRIWDAPLQLFQYDSKQYAMEQTAAERKMDDESLVTDTSSGQSVFVPFRDVVGSGGLSLKWSTLVDSGLCILSTRVSSAHGFEAYSSHPKSRKHVEHMANKGVIWALFDSGSKKPHVATLVFNTHLSSQRRAKRAQLRELASFIVRKVAEVCAQMADGIEKRESAKCDLSEEKTDTDIGGHVLADLEVYLCGDFNLDLENDTALTEVLVEGIGLEHLSTGLPTSGKQSRAIDHIWAMRYALTVVLATASGHLPVRWRKLAFDSESKCFDSVAEARASKPIIPWHLGQRHLAAALEAEAIKKKKKKKRIPDKRTMCLNIRNDISDHCWQCVAIYPPSDA